MVQHAQLNSLAYAKAALKTVFASMLVVLLGCEPQGSTDTQHREDSTAQAHNSSLKLLPYHDKWSQDIQAQFELSVRLTEVGASNNEMSVGFDIEMDIVSDDQLSTLPPYELWNEPFDMPRRLFITPVFDSEGNELAPMEPYTMNINGTEVRKLASYAELNGTISILRPAYRSPDGRYLIATIRDRTHNETCIVLDLKTRLRRKLSYGYCEINHWKGDSYQAYMTFVAGPFTYRYLVDIQTFEHEPLTFLQAPAEREAGGDKFQGMVKLVFSPDGQQIVGLLTDQPVYVKGEDGTWVRDTEIKRTLWDDQLPGQEYSLKFTAPDYQAERGAFYHPSCYGDGALRVSVDGRHFTCAGKVFHTDAPSEPIMDSQGEWIIQNPYWAISDSGLLMRTLRYNEGGPFERIYYRYRIPEDAYLNRGYFLMRSSLFIPPNLRDNWESRDWSEYFPELPSDEDYHAAKAKLTSLGRL